MRLVKRLANAGVASRRKSEELIAAGKVKLNGEIVKDPAHSVSEQDTIEVSGERLVADELETYLVNKPKGVISTASDEKGRKTVTGLVSSRARLYPVGRLDSDSSGLILLTNDGALANKLTHPRYEVPKTYQVELRGRITEEAIDALKGGVKLDDGKTAPADVVVKKRSKSGSILELTIHEGRNRQIRRMGDAVGFPVLKLTRVSLGPLKLGKLQPGEYRELTRAEQRKLHDATR
ncbi:rRNA pseudouridine synthase [Patescibacteria group bacterium]|nr:rRNA pseudouridine synthase [Patescibacteria group bacterium]